MSWGTRSGVTQSSYRDILDIRLTRWSEDFSTVEFPEGAAQTFKAGQPVKFASGLLIACVNSDTACAGIAVKDASGVTNTPIPILVANRSKIFIAKCSTTPVQGTHVGNTYEVALSAGLYTVNLGATTNVFFKVVGIPTGAATSTHENYQKALVIIADAAIQVK